MDKILKNEHLSEELENLKSTIQSFLKFTDGGENTLDFIVTKRIQDLDIVIKEWENDPDYLKDEENSNFVWDLLLNFQTLIKENPILKTTTVIGKYLKFIKTSLKVVDKKHKVFLNELEEYILEDKNSLFKKGYTRKMGKLLTKNLKSMKIEKESKINPENMFELILNFFLNIEVFLNSMIDIPQDDTISKILEGIQKPINQEIIEEQISKTKQILEYRMKIARKVLEEKVLYKTSIEKLRSGVKLLDDKKSKILKEYNILSENYELLVLRENNLDKKIKTEMSRIEDKEKEISSKLISQENMLKEKTQLVEKELNIINKEREKIEGEQLRYSKLVNNVEILKKILDDCDLEKFPQIFNNLVNLFEYSTMKSWYFIYSEDDTRRVICEKLQKIFEFSKDYEQRKIDYEVLTNKMIEFTLKMDKEKLEFDDYIAKEIKAVEVLKKTIGEEYEIILKYKEYNKNIEQIIYEKKKLENDILKGFVNVFLESKTYARDNDIFTQSICKLTEMTDISVAKLGTIMEEIMDTASKAQAKNTYLMDMVKKLEKKHAQEIKGLSERYKAMKGMDMENDIKQFEKLPAINFLFYFLGKRYKNRKNRDLIDEHHDCVKCKKITDPRFFLNYNITDHLIYFLEQRGYKNIIYYDPKNCCNVIEKIILDVLRYLNDKFPSKSILWYRNFLSKKYYPQETTAKHVTPYCYGDKKMIKKEKKNIIGENWDKNIDLRYKRFYYTYLIPEISNRNITYDDFCKTTKKETVFYKYYLQLNKEVGCRVGLKEMTVNALKQAEKKEKEKIMKKYVYFKSIYSDGKYEHIGSYKEKPFEKNTYILRREENQKYETKMSKICRENPNFKLYTGTNVKNLIKKIVLEEDEGFVNDILMAKLSNKLKLSEDERCIELTQDEKKIITTTEEKIIMGLYGRIEKMYRYHGDYEKKEAKQERILKNVNSFERERRNRVIKVESIGDEIPAIVLSNKYKVLKETKGSKAKLVEKPTSKKTIDDDEEVSADERGERPWLNDGSYIGFYHDSDSD